MLLLILNCRSTPAGRRYQLLQRQAEQLQEDFYRSETGRKQAHSMSVINKNVYILILVTCGGAGKVIDKVTDKVCSIILSMQVYSWKKLEKWTGASRPLSLFSSNSVVLYFKICFRRMETGRQFPLPAFLSHASFQQNPLLKVFPTPQTH